MTRRVSNRRMTIRAALRFLILLGAMVGIGITVLSADLNRVVVGIGTDLLSMIPMTATGPDPVKLESIFDTLLFRDTATSEVIPHIGSLEFLDDVTCRINLREGVRFHNGDELTASDLKFTIEWILDEANKSQFRARYAAISSLGGGRHTKPTGYTCPNRGPSSRNDWRISCRCPRSISKK